MLQDKNSQAVSTVEKQALNSQVIYNDTDVEEDSSKRENCNK